MADQWSNILVSSLYWEVNYRPKPAPAVKTRAVLVMKSLTRRAKVPLAYKSSSGVYKSAVKAITLTVMEGL